MTGASENFDPRVARSLCDLSGTAKLLCCRVDPLGRFVVAGAIDHSIQRWDLATGNRTTLAGHDNWVRTLSFATDGSTLHSGAYDGRWIAWEIAAEAPQPRHSVQAHTGWLRSLAVSHDGQRVVTCTPIRSICTQRILMGMCGDTDLHKRIHATPAGTLAAATVPSGLI